MLLQELTIDQSNFWFLIGCLYVVFSKLTKRRYTDLKSHILTYLQNSQATGEATERYLSDPKTPSRSRICRRYSTKNNFELTTA